MDPAAVSPPSEDNVAIDSAGGPPNNQDEGSTRTSTRLARRSNQKPKEDGSARESDFHDKLWEGDDEADDTSKENKGLKAETLDLNKKSNREAHHTDEYEVANLIIRRGQEFKMTVTFDKDVDLEKNKIRLLFTTGKNPQQNKGTLILVPIVTTLKDSEWGAVISSTEGPTVTLNVMTAADALVGEYSIKLQTWNLEETGEIIRRGHIYKHEENIYIIFNAWCEADAVYMPESEQRDEYVLNDTGIIYRGAVGSLRGKHWYYGQFDTNCFTGAIYLLEKSYLGKAAHGNPAQVVRAMSAMVNVQDDKGVLTGNWTNNYQGGLKPLFWSGSSFIMELYMASKRSVKWAQCWVFAGVTTTLCRALGIPTRCVSNFESAHDKDYSMTIDRHQDYFGRPLRHLDDSVWNYHVWNESWFTRPDLPKGHDGWQAFDATPQETSEGMVRCGPASVKAVKDGNVYLGYDTKFLFAEVNGDRVQWMVEPLGDMKPISVRPKSIGFTISTKAVGKDERLDVTDTYKYPEGSDEERLAVRRASQYSSRRENLEATIYKNPKHDVNFEFSGKMAKNGDLRLELKISSASYDVRKVEVHMYGVASYYTDIPGEELGEFKEMVELPSYTEKQVDWSLDARDYMKEMDEDANVNIYVMARVEETKQIFTAVERYEVDKPELDLKASSHTVKIGEPFTIEISFKNPLAVPLTDACFSLEGPGIDNQRIRVVNENIQPDEEVKETVTLKPRKKGFKAVIVSFSSKQLSDVEGVTVIAVQE